MTSAEAKANLNRILAAIYQDARAARMAVNFAGIDTSLIDWNGGVKIIWHDIIEVAEHTGKIDSLFTVVLRDHGGNLKLIQAIDDYRKVSEQSESSTVQKESQRRLRVFLCHASRDKEAVRNLYQQLRDDGVEPWLDAESLLPGQRWQEEIPKAIRRADVIVICLSKRSVDRKGYVQEEIKFALDIAENQPSGTISLIPVRLEECKVPDRLQRWHWVNLFESDGYWRLIQALRIRAQALGVREPRETLRPRKVEARSVWKRLRSRRVLGLMGVAISLILIAAIVNGSLEGLPSAIRTSVGLNIFRGLGQIPTQMPTPTRTTSEILTAVAGVVQTAEARNPSATPVPPSITLAPTPIPAAEPTDTPTPVPTPYVTIPPGFIPVTDARLGYSLAVPDGWSELDPQGEQFQNLVNTFGADALFEPLHDLLASPEGNSLGVIYITDLMSAMFGGLPTALYVFVKDTSDTSPEGVQRWIENSFEQTQVL